MRVEVVEKLPQGRLIARFEADHDTVLGVLKGAAPDEFLQQLEGVLREAVESGTWERLPVVPMIPEQNSSRQ